MHRPQSPGPGDRFSSSTSYHRQLPFNHHSTRPPYGQWKPQLSPNYRRDRPPGSHHHLHNPNKQQQYRRPNFVIQLRSKNPAKTDVIEALISKLEFKPESFRLFDKGYVVGTLFYQQWVEALETMVQIWDIRLNDGHSLTPKLIRYVEVSSDRVELKNRLRALFLDKLRGFFDCEVVGKWQKKLGDVRDEIMAVTEKLRDTNSLKTCNDLIKKREGLASERDVISKRIEEFKNGLKSMVDYLEGNGEEEREDGIGAKVGVFRYGSEVDWESIHSLMMRECRRLDDGLPIFAFRREILEQIHYQQISILIGETGSGKSTQLVQFLADSGVAGESVICTQPRKLAAISLAQRVKEESCGCYEDTLHA